MQTSPEEKKAIKDLADKITALRLEADGIHRLVAVMKNNNCFDAIEKLRLAKSHLGNSLGLLGIPNPYKKARSRQEIPPEVDVNYKYLTQYAYMDDFQYTEIARDHLHVLMADLRDCFDGVIRDKFILKSQVFWTMQHMVTAYLNVSEAANHLGFYLGEMRESLLVEKK